LAVGPARNEDFEKEEALKHYFQSMVDQIYNRFAHHFAGKNCYFIVVTNMKTMADS